MQIDKTTYDNLIANDMVESFEMFLQQRWYLDAIAGAPDAETFKVTLAIYDLEGLDCMTAADASEALDEAVSVEHHAFDTHAEAFAFAASFGKTFIETLPNEV